MNNGAHDWIEKSIPAGSGRYYALLHSHAELQPQQKLITSLISVFSKLGFQSREIEIAKQKHLWWCAELEKETFQHPVMVALAQTKPTPQTLEQIRRLLDGYGKLLQSGSPSTSNENQQFHLDTGATACHLLSNSDKNTAAVNDVGVALSKFRCLRYMRSHIENGLLCIPMPDLESVDLSPALLTPGENKPEVQAFFIQSGTALQTEMHQARSILKDHVSGVDATEQRNYKALYIYLMLQTKLLDALIKDDMPLLTEEIRLTPLRNYWQAFKAAREFDKLT